MTGEDAAAHLATANDAMQTAENLNARARSLLTAAKTADTDQQAGSSDAAAHHHIGEVAADLCTTPSAAAASTHLEAECPAFICTVDGSHPQRAPNVTPMPVTEACFDRLITNSAEGGHGQLVRRADDPSVCDSNFAAGDVVWVTSQSRTMLMVVDLHMRFTNFKGLMLATGSDAFYSPSISRTLESAAAYMSLFYDGDVTTGRMDMVGLSPALGLPRVRDQRTGLNKLRNRITRARSHSTRNGGIDTGNSLYTSTASTQPSCTTRPTMRTRHRRRRHRTTGTKTPSTTGKQQFPHQRDVAPAPHRPRAADNGKRGRRSVYRRHTGNPQGASNGRGHHGQRPRIRPSTATIQLEGITR